MPSSPIRVRDSHRARRRRPARPLPRPFRARAAGADLPRRQLARTPAHGHPERHAGRGTGTDTAGRFHQRVLLEAGRRRPHRPPGPTAHRHQPQQLPHRSLCAGGSGPPARSHDRLDRSHRRAPGIGIGSPLDPATRGSHVALTHPQAIALIAELTQHDLIVDCRKPDVIRLRLSPLTTRFADVQAGLDRLQSVSGAPKRDSSPPSSGKRVTDATPPSPSPMTNRPERSQRPSTSR
jgi:hypothetical protein